MIDAGDIEDLIALIRDMPEKPSITSDMTPYRYQRMDEEYSQRIDEIKKGVEKIIRSASASGVVKHYAARDFKIYGVAQLRCIFAEARGLLVGKSAFQSQDDFNVAMERAGRGANGDEMTTARLMCATALNVVVASFGQGNRTAGEDLAEGILKMVSTDHKDAWK